MAANDLEYYLAHGGKSRILHVGDKYGYDYNAHVHNYGGWANGEFSFGNLGINVGAKLGYQRFWREGLTRKGLFPGKEFTDPVSGITVQPAKDSKGEVITSFGNSKKAHFLTYAAKLGVNYVIGGNMRVYGNVGYFNDAPTFNQVFLSPRTRNSMVDKLTTVKTFASETQHLIYNLWVETEVICHVAQFRYLAFCRVSVSLCYLCKESHELKPVLLWHSHAHLSASLANLLFPRLLSMLLAVVEETEKDVITLIYGSLTKVRTKEIAHKLHL